MSYSIIFQTKIVRLPDGRIIHFDRSGCNNDDAGRKKNEFTAKIYTEDDFVKYADEFKKCSKPAKESDGWDLKIGSRCATYYDYGNHLLRMLKRAEDWEDFEKNHMFHASYCNEIEILKPEHKVVPVKEFEKMFYTLSNFTYRRIMEYLYEMEDIVGLLEENKPMEFYIN